MRAWFYEIWKRQPAIGKMLSQREFARVLQQERMRADRNLSTLSVASFRETSRRPSELSALARLVSCRVRATDTCGFDSQGRIAALLPETPEEGAWKVVSDIKALWTRSSSLDADVMVYSAGARPKVVSEAIAVGARLPRATATAMSSDAAVFTQPLPLWKRALDVGGALLCLTLLSPVLVLTAVLIGVTSGRPILFRQLRTGLGGRPFWMYKFRTMCHGAEQMQSALLRFNEQDGAAFKLSNDPRVTRLGTTLRTLSIDELPQLWNVLVGQMSLVGPRPLPCAESDDCETWQRRRLDVTPGLTCLWQVSGRSSVRFDEWMRMDLRYIVARSLATDLSLLLRTIPAVILRRGAH